MEKIGMVGVGTMGCALLERLRLAGVQAVVYDAHPPALETARSMGADIAPSAKAVAQAATIIDVVVRTDQDVVDCMLGENAILDGAQPGTLVLFHSTILPETTQRMGDAARQRDVYVIDACMVDVPSVVQAGELSFLTGGPAELVDRARPHLLRMGKQVLHMGPLGAGNVAKLISNLVMGAERLIVHEAISIGEAGGISYRDALEMLRKIHSGSLLNRWQDTFDSSGASSKPRAGRNIFGKDLPLAAELARQYGIDIPITEQLLAAGNRLLGVKGSR